MVKKKGKKKNLRRSFKTSDQEPRWVFFLDKCLRSDLTLENVLETGDSEEQVKQNSFRRERAKKTKKTTRINVHTTSIN